MIATQRSHGLDLSAEVLSYPLRSAFTIARGSRTEAVVVAVSITDGTATGRGECTPYARYGETPESVLDAITSAPLSRVELQTALPAGAARNAVDCALWDFAAKSSGHTVSALAGLPAIDSRATAYTLSLDTPDAMARAARANTDKPILKIKLGSPGDVERLNAIRAARPDARIIVDANEGWNLEILPAMFAAASGARVDLIEQPLPAGRDDALRDLPRPVPVCADESFHTRADLARIATLYDAVNIKLDKTGGLTEALAVRRQAQALGLRIMVGCMLGSSLAMAPAMLVAQDADWIDLDGPLLLAADTAPPIGYRGATMFPPSPELWG
ncbi:MAG TPA: dipeptide epimerase [Hyphomicrobiaceae bacterium]|nr:dipeptide epimerase [Hyphomicrobiaceae bacterium]